MDGLQKMKLSPNPTLVSDTYLKIKKGVCPLDWAMVLPLNIRPVRSSKAIWYSSAGEEKGIRESIDWPVVKMYNCVLSLC